MIFSPEKSVQFWMLCEFSLSVLWSTLSKHLLSHSYLWMASIHFITLVYNSLLYQNFTNHRQIEIIFLLFVVFIMKSCQTLLTWATTTAYLFLSVHIRPLFLLVSQALENLFLVKFNFWVEGKKEKTVFFV